MTGQSLPDFCLKDEQGNNVCSKDLKGKWTVLYFYPKDNTPGCTTEAKDFTCMVEDFSKEDARIIGASPDSEKSHLSFIGKQELKLTLLSDPNKELLEKMGAWKKKSMYGKEYMGVVRTTFLIDEKGKVEGIFGGTEGIEKVKTKEHADQVIKFWELKL
jgi:peroxiredoxin Q/BCP